MSSDYLIIVRLRDPETGKLSDLQPLRGILERINSKSEYVQLVSQTPEPIVKIVDRYVEITRAREAELKEREAARQQQAHKEIQVSWFSAPADFAHKLDRVREELSRGVRVDLVLSRKSEQPKISPQDMAARAAEIRQSLADVAKECKPSEIHGRQGIYALFFEPTGTTTSATTAAGADAATPENEATSAGKKIPVPPEFTPRDIDDVVRRVGKELAKGGRVEVVLSAKQHPDPQVEQDDKEYKQELGIRASKVLKELKNTAQEWTGRRYQPNVLKLTLYLEPKGGVVKVKKAMVHKPKKKKLKDSDIPDLFQD
ncbi:hypothetical protein H0H92_004721 [Tricholoma furcatifolium]|nr:hypothetical protein H0H92_004721 [Tricholoma furcatifolium]